MNNDVLENMKPRMYNGIYHDYINSDAMFFYNPEGTHGLIIVDVTLGKIVLDCDGTFSIQELSLKHNADTGEVIAHIPFLVRNQVLECPSLTTSMTLSSHYVSNTRVVDCWLHVTNQCNLNCTYCYINKSSDFLSLDLAYRQIDYLAETYKKNKCNKMILRLAGGEPLLRTNFIFSIANYVKANYHDIQAVVAIITNGTLLSPEIAKKLFDEDIQVSISLDGLEAYHNSTRLSRQFNNVFNATMQGIRNALEAGLRPSILTTITPENLPGIPELTSSLIELGVPFRYSFQKEYGSEPDLSRIDDKLFEYLNRSISIIESEIKKGNTKIQFGLNDIRFDKRRTRTCGAGVISYACGANGEIGICGMGLQNPMFVSKGGNDTFQRIEEIDSDLVRLSIDSVDDCRDCTWRHSCAGGCLLQNKSTYGTYFHKSPYCNLLRKIIPNYIHLQAMQAYYQRITSATNPIRSGEIQKRRE